MRPCVRQFDDCFGALHGTSLPFYATDLAFDALNWHLADMSIIVYQNALFAGRIVQYNELEPLPEEENRDKTNTYLDFLDRWGDVSGRIELSYMRAYLPLARRIASSLPPGLAQRVAYEFPGVHEAFQEQCLDALPNYAVLWQETLRPHCPEEGWEPSSWTPELGVARELQTNHFEEFLEFLVRQLTEFAAQAEQSPSVQLPPPMRSLPQPDPWPSHMLLRAFRLELALHFRVYELLVDAPRAQAFIGSLAERREIRFRVLPLLKRRWRPTVRTLLEAARAFSMDSPPDSKDDWLLLHYDVAASVGGWPEAADFPFRDPRTWLVERRTVGRLHAVTDPGISEVDRTCTRALSLPHPSSRTVLVIIWAPAVVASSLPAPTASVDWALAGAVQKGRGVSSWACLQELLQGWRYTHWILANLLEPLPLLDQLT
eukprot:gnl/TRDRNA2_/TRDRNA2_162681_c1_seq4.p1 gnl/TRDRNA2_/TRDRNA2_162681_c1~~gnl/TRDRNA2_/TRDRNA2_162681_c1_seq4.p1  ORF type:complete len:439 (+),score=51.02 gnl/TRDRNA2_/TRDRNA2_162681_c1_seq4:28-1317(+)